MALDCVCGGKTEVIDSRPRSDGKLRRRRRCLECGERSTTVELFVSEYDAIKADSVQAAADVKTLARALEIVGQKVIDIT